MPEMKKLELKVDINDQKEKQKVLKAVSGLSGIDSLSMEMKDKKLTVIGDVDPVEVVSKLRKNWHTEIVSVGPNKKDEPKKDGGKKEEDKNKTENEKIQEFWKNHYGQYPCIPHRYVVHSVEEDPNSCVIC